MVRRRKLCSPAKKLLRILFPHLFSTKYISSKCLSARSFHIRPSMLRFGQQDKISIKGVAVFLFILITVYACLSRFDVKRLTLAVPKAAGFDGSVHHKYGVVHAEKTGADPETTFEHRSSPVILIWSYLYNLESEGPRPGRLPQGCTISNDRNDLPHASAVLFEYTSLGDEEATWQHYRHPEQVFIFRSEESPPTMKHWFDISLEKFGNNFINWTMTYRRDADVYCPYTGWNLAELRTPEEEQKRIDEIVAKKSKVALWLVSNCGANGALGALRRMEYVTALSDDGMEIDKFGKCFENKAQFQSMSPEDKDSYKFYIAFENSYHCRDYLTEKFWRNALSQFLVPIVWGPSRKDMEELAPPHSYIFAEDFDSNESLANYVRKLAQNDTEYKRYFEWRLDPRWRKELDKWSGNKYCIDLACNHLKENIANQKRKSIPDLDAFWYGTESKECMKP